MYKFIRDNRVQVIKDIKGTRYSSFAREGKKKVIIYAWGSTDVQPMVLH